MKNINFRVFDLKIAYRTYLIAIYILVLNMRRLYREPKIRQTTCYETCGLNMQVNINICVNKLTFYSDIHIYLSVKF